MRKLLIVAFALILVGCASPSVVHHYSSSVENVVLLRATGNRQVNIGEFTDSQFRVKTGCRGKTLIAPGGKPYSDYIRNALILELANANLYSPVSDRIITGELLELNLSSMTNANWLISIKLNLPTGETLEIEERHHFPSAFAGDTACNIATHAFVTAVQNLIKATTTSPKFRNLIVVPPKSPNTTSHQDASE